MKKQEIEKTTRNFEEESALFKPLKILITTSGPVLDATLMREMIFQYYHTKQLLPDEHHALIILLQNTQFAKLTELIQTHPELGIDFWRQKISAEKKAQVISTTQYRMLLELLNSLF